MDEILLQVLVKDIQATGFGPEMVVRVLNALLAVYRKEVPAISVDELMQLDPEPCYVRLRQQTRQMLELLFTQFFPNGTPGILDEANLAAFVNAAIQYRRNQR